MRQFRRHGDLLIEKVDNKPENTGLVKEEKNILLEGEATGHLHRLIGEEIETYRKINIVLADRFYAGYFLIPKTAELVHEEHETITFDQGIYKIYIQREYDPIEEKRVID